MDPKPQEDKLSHWWGTDIRVFLQKYNHLQPPGAADFFHGGHNSESGRIF